MVSLDLWTVSSNFCWGLEFICCGGTAPSSAPSWCCFLLLCVSNLPLLRSDKEMWLDLAAPPYAPGNPVFSLYVKILNFITFAKTLFLCKATFKDSPDIFGDYYSAYYRGRAWLEWAQEGDLFQNVSVKGSKEVGQWLREGWKLYSQVIHTNMPYTNIYDSSFMYFTLSCLFTSLTKAPMVG